MLVLALQYLHRQGSFGNVCGITGTESDIIFKLDLTPLLAIEETSNHCSLP